MPEATNSLDAELRALAGELRAGQPADGLVDAVLHRIGAEPVPGRSSRFAQTVRRVRGWLLARWRSVLAALGVLLIGLALAPPVRATVAEWFGFDGVIVRLEPGPVPSTTPAPPVASSNLTLDQARRLLRFAPLVPAALGPPSGVPGRARGGLARRRRHPAYPAAPARGAHPRVGTVRYDAAPRGPHRPGPRHRDRHLGPLRSDLRPAGKGSCPFPAGRSQRPLTCRQE